MTGLERRRPLPDGQPVLPHVRAEGRASWPRWPPAPPCSPSRCSTSTACSPRWPSEGVTVLPGAPTLYQGMLDHPDRDRYDLSTLRVAVTGAADIPVELIRRVDAELPFSAHHHRIRPDRGRHGGGHVARGRRRDHRHDGRPTPPGLRAADRRRQRTGTSTPGSPARSSCGVAASCPTTSTTRRRPPRRSSADGWLRTGDLGDRRPQPAACASSGAPRTCSSSVGSTPTLRRSRTPCCGTRTSAEAAVDRHPRRAARRGGHGVRRRRARARRSTGADIVGVEPRPDGQLQGPPGGGDRRRAPAQRHRQGGQGRPPPAAGSRTATGPSGVSGPGSHGLSSLAGPAGRRARGVGGGAVGRRPAGRLGRRGHQGRVPERGSDAQRLRVPRHRRRPPQPGLRPRQPGQAQRRPRPA